MEHEHYTSGPEDERRAWLPIVAVVVLVAALVGSIFLPWRDEGPAEVTGTPPSLGAPASTVAATTTPSVTAPVDLAPPPVTLPPAPTTDEPLDTGGAPLDETAQDLRDALAVVADGAA